MGRNRKFNEEDSLMKAKELFWTKGYEATTLDDLLEVMLIKKSSFYNTYGNKQALFLRTIQLHDEQSFSQFSKMLNKADDKIALLKSLFLSFAETSEPEDARGCYAGNIIVEMNTTHTSLTNLAKEYLLKLEGIFFEVIEDSKETGGLRTTIHSKILSNYLLNLWNGIHITKRLFKDKSNIKKLIEFQLELLK